MDKEKEYDGKLYRVVRRKDSHVNTKINPDGMATLFRTKIIVSML